jgi:hypothetical protein
MALDFANLQGYELQPKKSVAIHIRGNNKQCETTNEKLNMGNITMPEMEQATHLGIIRTTTMKHNHFSLVVIHIPGGSQSQEPCCDVVCTSCVVNVDVSYFQSYTYILQTV